MVCDVQSTGMMRGIVREATVQLEPRGIRLCDSRVPRERTMSKGSRKNTHILFVYCIVTWSLKTKQEHQENSEVR
jgi:hypothetical protein